ncbi:hypothetical protein LOAG_12745 [Loa loa]|uniref:Uncharacterized protein n=1 Tax=Loa loa TaxID=7209 RepID=A0A1S0TKL1_LOALO|nr:hypothetical protein LOAG_12745 [Loa loa]EFO15764.1 hypothetical protein LOAG_12745 [Loa loa]
MDSITQRHLSNYITGNDIHCTYTMENAKGQSYLHDNPDGAYKTPSNPYIYKRKNPKQFSFYNQTDNTSSSHIFHSGNHKQRDLRIFATTEQQTTIFFLFAKYISFSISPAQ